MEVTDDMEIGYDDYAQVRGKALQEGLGDPTSLYMVEAL